MLGKLNGVGNSGKKMRNDCSAWRLQKPCALSGVKDTWSCILEMVCELELEGRKR